MLYVYSTNFALVSMRQRQLLHPISLKRNPWEKGSSWWNELHAKRNHLPHSFILTRSTTKFSREWEIGHIKVFKRIDCFNNFLSKLIKIFFVQPKKMKLIDVWKARKCFVLNFVLTSRLLLSNHVNNSHSNSSIFF